jgi:hypothetical protein
MKPLARFRDTVWLSMRDNVWPSVRDAIRPRCSACGTAFFWRHDKVAELQRLKPLGEYEAGFDAYKHLCARCWAKIATVRCDLCRASFDVFALNNQRDTLTRNLQSLSVELDEVSRARRVCHSCSARRLHCRCDHCSQPFPAARNAAGTYRSNADVPKWLAPYHKDYGVWSQLCPDCYDGCLASCKDVQARLSQGIESTKGEQFRDFRIVKRLGRVHYKERECGNPAEVEDRLSLYTAQLGGNAFVKYYWEKHSQHPRQQWFTGYADAVIVEPFAKGRPTSAVMADGPISAEVKHLLLDGSNICRWASRDKPDLRILLTLAVEAVHRKIPFLVFFDANMPHLLAECSDELSVAAYKRITEALPEVFVEVPGRTRADEFILPRAGGDGSHIISNDQYRDFADRYPWILAGERLIKGIVAGDRLSIPKLDIDLQVLADALAAADVLVKTIELQRGVPVRRRG